jgi:hypothetical protein
VTTIDFRTDPATARATASYRSSPRRHPRHRLGRRRDRLHGVWSRDARAIGSSWSGLSRSGRQREEVTMPDRDNAELRRGQSVADACKGTRIPRNGAKRQSPLPTRSWRRLFRSCRPILSIG